MLSFYCIDEMLGGVVISGYLHKKGPTAKHGWKLRFFALQGQFLRYYKKESDTKELGCVQLSKVINLWTNSSSQEPPRPAYATFMFCLDTMQSSGIPRAFLLCALTQDSKNQWCSALQGAIEVYRGERLSEPVSLVQNLHIQQNANLEEIMHQLASANGLPAPSSPGRLRAATAPNRPAAPAAVVPVALPVVPNVPSSPRRNTSTSPRPPPPSLSAPPVPPAESGRKSPDRPLPGPRKAPDVAVPVPGVRSPNVGASRVPVGNNRPLPKSQPAVIPTPVPPKRPVPAARVVAKPVVASMDDELQAPQSAAPPPPTKQKVTKGRETMYFYFDSTRKAKIAPPLPPSVSTFDETSSGYDTEEVVEPFLQERNDQEHRLVMFDFEAYEEDHVSLQCGDKVSVEVVEGEWMLVLNLRSGLSGWCPVEYCSTPL